MKNINAALVTLLGIGSFLTGCSSSGTQTDTPVVTVKAIETKRSEKEEATKFKRFELDSKKAVRASWSIQNNEGGLDIELPSVADDAESETPYTQVWLLHADGTASKASGRPESPVGISMRGFTTPHLTYVFTEKATASGIAVVIQVEKEFFAFPVKE